MCTRQATVLQDTSSRRTPARWYVHVNRNIIDSNRKNGTDDPPITIKRGTSRRVAVARDVICTGGVRIHYEPAGILPCGAKVVIETTEEPVIVS